MVLLLYQNSYLAQIFYNENYIILLKESNNKKEREDKKLEEQKKIDNSLKNKYKNTLS